LLRFATVKSFADTKELARTETKGFRFSFGCWRLEKTVLFMVSSELLT